MNFKLYTLFFMSFLLTGCATGHVDYTDIDSNETVIAGHIDVNLIYNRLGVVKSKRTVLPGKSGSIIIKKYTTEISELTLSGWESIEFDENGNLFSPIEPGKYVLEIFNPHFDPAIPGEYTVIWEFLGEVFESPPNTNMKAIADNTFIIDIKPGVINYIGNIQFNRIFLSVNQGDITVYNVGIDDNFDSFKEKIIEKSNNEKIIRSLAEQHILSDILSGYHVLDVAK